MPGRILAIALLIAWGTPAAARAADEAGLEFFEKRVRPLLAARCYECHSGNAKRLEGKLRLDSLAATLKGGETGPAIMPGKPKESLLVDAINYGELYQMPPKGKLPAEEIAILTKWVELGAPWPKEDVASSAASSKDFDLAKRKAAHWCWQPIANPPVPTIRNPKSEIRNPLDAFILARLQEKGLSPAPPADKRTLIRRAYFDLIGLPPSPEEVEAFLKDDSPQAFEKVVKQLLDSPHFGERWGRHWLDLVRYAESRGHEFDYNIPNAHEYRDYVIRALNADVPYGQFVTEHIAGDLLAGPRLNPKDGSNESIVGTGFWFLGEWCHSPVDIRKDECDRVDNMLDVATKTFLGVTVTCARCHDHKFDAISQKDYYALSGYLQSSSYRLTRFEAWQQDRQVAADLTNLDAKHRPLLAAAAEKAIEAKADELAAALGADFDNLKPLLEVEERAAGSAEVVIDYANCDAAEWMADGPTFGPAPVRAGDLLLPHGDLQPLEIAASGAARRDAFWNGLSGGASEGDAGRLSGWLRAGRTLKTPTFTLTTGQVHYLIEGVGHVYSAVDSHAMINGPLHGELAKDTGGNADLPARWITHDLSRYAGHRVHLEFSPKGDEDFRVRMIVQGERPPAPSRQANQLLAQVQEAQKSGSKDAVAVACRNVVMSAASCLAADKPADDKQFADKAIVANWLLAQVSVADELPVALAQRLAEYRSEQDKLAARVRRESRLCLAMWDGTPVDENLLIRGNHKTVGPVVPRRIIEAVQQASGGRQPPEETAGAGNGRLELARQIVDPENPLTSRVMVNRVWQHLMGRGIVPSVDNFGVLGQEPTHPELVDHLATQFMQDGWSVKRLIRAIMLSDTYQRSSIADFGLRIADSQPESVASNPKSEIRNPKSIDPQNLLFHRQNIKRLEGEAIRDSILAISGRLDRTQFGTSVPIYLTEFMQGRGRPGASGPLDGSGRRSIYIAIRRNFLSPMMLAFDTPIPFSTVGRRNVSNVPAQALILMNDPFVSEQARVWASKLLADKSLATPEARIRRMYSEAFSREATDQEIAAGMAFLEQQAREYGLASGANQDERVWADLAHVLFNVKEFVLVE
jgi:hypothetical protein